MGADLAVGGSEIAALLGPSGCGKSTLLRIAAGLERPDRGRVLAGGEDVTGLPPERRGIGMVFQDFALFPHMSAGENIEYGPRMRGLSRAERRRTAEAVAESLGIAGLLGRAPSTLSGGEQQRVALARTLAAAPRAVLLDEPLSSLDYGLRRRLRAEIAERLREAGAAAIHVTHDVEEAFAVADRVLIMREGSIVARGAPEELYSSPPDAWTASFLGLGPVLAVSRIAPSAGGGPPLAWTALGPFAFARGPAAGAPGGAPLSLFFPAGAVRPLGPGAGAAPDAPNVIRGRVASSSFASGRRRVALDCAAGAGGAGLAIRLELDAPLGYRPAPGEEAAVEASPAECRLLPGTGAG